MALSTTLHGTADWLLRVTQDEDASWFEMQLDLIEKIGEQHWLAQQL